MEVIFFVLPISSIALFFLQDNNKDRRTLLNMLLLFNLIVFISPVILAYNNTSGGESMWNENTGGGAYLWLYILIFPLCTIIWVVLLILKIVYHNKKINEIE